MLQSSARCVALEEHNEGSNSPGAFYTPERQPTGTVVPARTIMPIPDEDEGVRIKGAQKLLFWLVENSDRAVNLSGRVSRMQASGSGQWGLLPTHATDFGPDLEFLGSWKLCAWR
jgi:hypothetical protein